jgi:fumarylacetoacetate (FAA) hydrolase
LCKTRNVRSGSIVGSGTVSNKGIEKNGRTEWPKGYSCIAEKRAMETLQEGKPSTEYLKFGDSVRIEMKSANGQPLLGAIDQKIADVNKARA